MEVNRPGDKLSGYVTHNDSILYMTDGYYSISVYNADSLNPFNRVPVRTDSLNLKKRDWLYETPFTMNGIPSGRYFVAATWSKYPKVPNEVPIVLGTYGCDTIVNCSAYQMISYPNYEGKFRNIQAWTNPARRLN
ncbi:MAG TPA: hypothetical protein DCX92_02955 [Bacteroidetes bacterium]|nr:hypothetical protein [Bacteroidota bacterium]